MTQLAEEDELLWDDGTATPEPCLDRFDLVTKVCRKRSTAQAAVGCQLGRHRCIPGSQGIPCMYL